MKISTNFDYPPIPIRTMDWSAIESDTYDGAPDAGYHPIGRGRTEADAVKDLAELWLLRDEQPDEDTLHREAAKAVERGDTTTYLFVCHLRESVHA